MGKFSKLNLTLIRGWKQGKLNSCFNLEHMILSWEVAQGIQNIPDSSLQYANDNALLLAKVLWHNFSLASLQLVSVDYWFLILTKCSAAVFKGSIACYFLLVNVLVCITSVGLVLLGLQLKSKKDWVLGVLFPQFCL